jgi:hypothetical protein
MEREACGAHPENINQMKPGNYYTQELYLQGDDLFTRKPSLIVLSNGQDTPAGNGVLLNGQDTPAGSGVLPNGPDTSVGKASTESATSATTPVGTVSGKPRSLAALKGRLEAQGYHCNIKVLAQFLCGLNTNQIIILHGAPGMGKTSFVKQLAKALGAECRIIPVRPNWIDNQDLTGYFNPVGHRYYATPFLDALCEARNHSEKASHSIRSGSWKTP